MNITGCPEDSEKYHPYRLPKTDDDWINEVDVVAATALAASQLRPLRILVLYGSLRTTSYSRSLAFEMSRLLEVSLVLIWEIEVVMAVLIDNPCSAWYILQKMGADVRVFDPSTLPVKHDRDDVPEAAQELRHLSFWS